MTGAGVTGGGMLHGASAGMPLTISPHTGESRRIFQGQHGSKADILGVQFPPNLQVVQSSVEQQTSPLSFMFRMPPPYSSHTCDAGKTGVGGGRKYGFMKQ